MQNLVSLQTLGGGAAVEKFDYELQRAIDNVSDWNTSPTATREVKLIVKIKPNEDRSFATVEIQSGSKLAPVKPEITSLHISGNQASEFNPRQEKIVFQQQIEKKEIDL